MGEDAASGKPRRGEVLGLTGAPGRLFSVFLAKQRSRYDKLLSHPLIETRSLAACECMVSALLQEDVKWIV